MSKAVNVFFSSVVLLAALSEPVHAASIGPYFGVGAGYSALQPASDAYMEDEGGLGGRVFAGYNFNQYFGLESNYARFFKTRYVLNDYQNVAIDYKLAALSVVAKGYLPFPENGPFNLYASIGAAQAYADIDANVHSTTFFIESASGVVPVLGFGASYDLNKRFMTVLDCALYGKKKADDNHFGIRSGALATVGLAYKFQ